jgi:hypothetical protein
MPVFRFNVCTRLLDRPAQSNGTAPDRRLTKTIFAINMLAIDAFLVSARGHFDQKFQSEGSEQQSWSDPRTYLVLAAMMASDTLRGASE